MDCSLLSNLRSLWLGFCWADFISNWTKFRNIWTFLLS